MALKLPNFGGSTLLLPTAISVTQNELEYWTNLTCFYDKQWQFDSKKVTTPIAFVNVLKSDDTIRAEVSKKRVILYEAPSTKSAPGAFTVAPLGSVNSHPAYKNNLEVIVDNVVVDPKQYQIDAIVPDSLIGPYITQGMKRLTTLIDFMGMTYGGGISWLETVAKTVQNIQTGIKIAQDGIDVFDRLFGSMIGSTEMARINLNSLEAMAKSGHKVLFKKWTGYNFSYGVFSDLTTSKRPNERGVSRATLTFQEAPVLNITQKRAGETSISSILNTISSATNQVARVATLALAYPFILMTGVLGEAGGVGTDAPGSTLGSWDIF